MAKTDDRLIELQKGYEELVTTLIPFNHDKINATQTLYQALTSIGTRDFLDILGRSPQLLSALQGDGSEYTVFLPYRENLEDMGHLTGETMNEFLSLHNSAHYIIIPDTLLHMTNIPVYLQTSAANGPHTIPTHFVGGYWRVSGNQIVEESIYCSNGIIHQITSRINPVQSYITILKNHSTIKFQEALRLPGVSFPAETKGCTIFAPLDSAFEKLGNDINQFLFNTDTGLPYLQALIKLHLVPNITIYSNLIWPKNATGQRTTSRDIQKKLIRGVLTHELPTLLETATQDIVTIAVTIVRYNRPIELTVNGIAKVVDMDIASREGVVHVIDKVLLPGSAFASSCTVEQLREILRPYVWD